MCNSKRLKAEELIEGEDFNWEETGGVRLRVFTKEYLISIRPACCENFCKNCPWEYGKKA